MRFKIFKFNSVTSTNDVAINLIKDKKKEIGCVQANFQTRGRGTKGREWISDIGNLFISIFFPLEKNFPPFNEFSIINSIILSNVIMHFCDKKNVNLKFPNDIFVNKKKICGLLQEIITLNSKKYLIIGIGVNIVSNPEINGKYQATNILFETKKNLKVDNLTNLIISSYEKFFTNINSYNYLNYKKKAEFMSIT